MSPEFNNREAKELYEKYAPMVFHRCKSILGSEDEAWDATQDVFMKMMNSLATIRQKGSLYSWLLTASTNHCISVLRKSRTVGYDENIHSGAHSTDSATERRLAARQILGRLFRPWDKKVRDIFVLTYIDGYKQEEIARITGMGESTVRKYLTLLRRHAEKLRPTLEGGQV